MPDEEPKQRMRMHWVGVCILFAVLIAVVVLLPTVYVNLATRSSRYELSRVPISQVPKRQVGIVLGAALSKNGTELSKFLEWRVQTAVNLYKAGRVNSLLMSGDGSYSSHDEPAIMRQVAIKLGVPADKIAMDKFGFDTYDSCTRAKTWRDITSATVITQGYHLPRAVYSCQQTGIDTVGVNAQSAVGQGWTPYGVMREWLSTDKLFIQLARHDIASQMY